MSRRTVLLGVQTASELGNSPRFRESEAPGSPASGPIVGAVVFTTHRGERAEAILDADGRWSCPKLRALDRVLNILFEPRRDAIAPFGHAELDRVAAWIKRSASVRLAGAVESS